MTGPKCPHDFRLLDWVDDQWICDKCGDEFSTDVYPAPVTNAGPSLLEKLWAELDSVMSRLMADGPPEHLDCQGYSVEWEDFEAQEKFDAYKAWGEERGQAQGLAFAIATIENPYQPNMPAVKARAVQRWEAAQ